MDLADTSSMPTKHQFAKMILASVAAFVAGKLMEKAYDSYYEHHVE